MTQPLFEYRLELAGFATRALELEGAGPPLVLLHGFADSADTWRRTLDLLGRREQRAIAFDLPGFATADPLHADRPVLDQLDRFTAAAVRLASGPDAEPVVLSGNSLGGCLSLRAGENDDLPLRGLVPVAPAGLEHPQWFRIIEASPVVRWVLDAPVPLPEGGVRAAVGQAYRRLAFARPRRAAREVVESFTSHHRERSAISSYLATGRRLISELDDPFRLDRVRVPVLLVWGERDRMVPHRGSRRVIEALPETTYELLPGVGHCPQIEAAERFAELLVEFMTAPAARAA